jgi:hypothetical protein
MDAWRTNAMMIGTKQAAAILGLPPGTLAKAVWDGRVAAPAKAPGGAYVWTLDDLRRASWALLHRELDESAAAGREAMTA